MSDPSKGGPKSYIIAGAAAAGFVLGYVVCHFHVCERIGLCKPEAVLQVGPLDPGPLHAGPALPDQAR
jgi:hypothetical protein